jgi:hypothetical protein
MGNHISISEVWYPVAICPATNRVLIKPCVKKGLLMFFNEFLKGRIFHGYNNTLSIFKSQTFIFSQKYGNYFNMLAIIIKNNTVSIK